MPGVGAQAGGLTVAAHLALPTGLACSENLGLMCVCHSVSVRCTRYFCDARLQRMNVCYVVPFSHLPHCCRALPMTVRGILMFVLTLLLLPLRAILSVELLLKN